MRRSWASIALAVCFGTCSAVDAHAAPGRFELAWSAPAGCPSGARIEQRVAQTLDRPLVIRDDEVLVVRALVEQPERDQPWRVELETDNGQRRSKRSLNAASCDELAEATALVVAILIEPNVEHAEPTGPPARPLPPAVAAATPAAPERRAPARFALGAFAGTVSGLLPAWSSGMGLEGGVAWKALRWNVAAGYWLPVEQSAPDNEAQGARFRLLSAAAELCLMAPIQHRVSVGVCSGPALAYLRAEGYGPGVGARTEHANFLVFSGGARFAWAASNQLEFVLVADALVPFGRRRFVFDGSAPAPIHTPGAGLQLTFGVQWWLGKTETPSSGPTTQQ